MSCTIAYKGKEYSEKEFQDTMENKALAEAVNSISDYPSSQRDSVIAERFYLKQLPNGKFVANQKQLDALREWMNKPGVMGVKMITNRLKTETQSLHLVSFFTPENTKESERTVAITKKVNYEEQQGDRELISQTLDKLTAKIPGLSYVFINSEQLVQEEHIADVNLINAFVKDGVIYMVEGRVNVDTAMQEALHPFIESLYNDNRGLFNELLRTAKKEHFEVYEHIANLYDAQTGYSSTDINKEFVTRIFQEAMRLETTDAPKQTKWQFLISRFFKWLSDFMGITKGDELSSLAPSTSMKELAIKLNLDVIKTHLQFTKGEVFYDLKSDEQQARVNLLMAQPDERFSQEALSVKLAHQKAQLNMISKNIDENLNPVYGNAITKQREKLVLFQKATQKYIDLLEDAIKTGEEKRTGSVSDFTGMVEFVDVDQYESFSGLGIMLGQLISDLQKETLGTEVQLSKAFTRSKFNEIYDKIKTTHPTGVTLLSEDEIYDMAGRIINAVGNHADTGSIILPQMVFAGVRADGRHIIAHNDLTVIDTKGEVHIVHFKSQKINNMTSVENPKADATKAKIELTARSKQATNNSTFTQPEFNNEYRSTFDNWATQLLATEYILRQNDITISRKDIVSLLYESKDKLTVNAWTTHIFHGNLYDYMAAIVDKNSEKLYTDFGKEYYKKIEDIVDRNITLTEDQSKKRKANIERFAFNISEEGYEALELQMKELIALNRNELWQEVNRLEATKTYRNKPKDQLTKEEKQTEENIAMHRKRIETLNSFEQVIVQGEDWLKSVKVKFVIDSLDTDIKSLQESWNTLAISENSSQRHEAARSYEAMATKMHTLINLLKSELEQQKEHKLITQDAPVFQTVLDLELKLNAIKDKFRTYSLYSTATLLYKNFAAENSDPNVVPEAIANVMKEMKLAVEPRIAKLEQLIEDIEGGKTLSRKNKAYVSVVKFFNPTQIEAHEKKMDPLLPEARAMVVNLQEKINGLKSLYEFGEVFNVESIVKFLNGVTDVSNLNYMGSSDPVLGALFTGNVDQFFASASNSDFMLSGFTMYMKNALADAQGAMQDSFAENDLQNKIDKAHKNLSQKQLNDAITEIVNIRVMENNVQVIDENGDPVYRQELHLVSPVSQRYTQYFEEQKNAIISREKEIRAVKESIHLEKDYAKQKEIIETLKQLQIENQLKKDEYLDWQLMNSSMLYVEDFYKIGKLLPPELRGELENIQLQIELLMNEKGKGNEEDVDEETYDQIRQLIIDMKMLKRESSETSSDEYAEYVAAVNKFYEYSDDTSAYNIVLDRKQKEYANQPEKLQRFIDRNTVKVATKAFYAKRKELYDRVTELTKREQDSNLKEMRDRKNKIMFPYNHEGVFDPEHMTEKDRNELEEVVQAIEEYNEENRKGASTAFIGLTAAEQKELKGLFKEIKELTRNALNNAYVETRFSFENTLFSTKKHMDIAATKVIEAEAAGVVAEIDAANDELMQATYDFGLAEETFKKWYNEHHYADYISINSVAKVDYTSAKLFLYEKVPVSEEHYAPKPINKWFKRNISEAAYNPNYKEMADGTPMPKGIIEGPNGELIVTAEASKENLNEKYIALSQNTDAYDLYNTLTKMYFEMQKRISLKRAGYRVPGAKGTGIENFTERNLSDALRGEFGKMRDVLFTLPISQEDIISNEYGDTEKRIRHRHNEQYTLDIQSSDAVSSLLKWMHDSHVNEAMTAINAETEISISFVDSTITMLGRDPIKYEKRIKDLKHLKSQMVFEKGKLVHGITEQQGARKVKKALAHVMTIASFGRLGFDLIGQLKNYASGNIQAFLAADPSSHYSVKDYIWAKGQIYGMNGFIGKYIADWGKAGNLSKETLTYRRFNPVQKDQATYLSNAGGKRSRRLLEKLSSFQELAYIFQDKGDTEIGMTVWLATMHAKRFRLLEKDAQGNWVPKVKADGTHETVTALDVYFVDAQGKLAIREDVEFTKQNERRIRNIVYSEIRRAQGNYAKSDMTASEATVLGKFIFYFKKYLIPQVLNRVGTLRPNWEGEQAALGYWNAMYSMLNLYSGRDFFSYLLFSGFSKKAAAKAAGTGSKVNSYYAAKAAHASRELILGAILTSLSLLMLGLVKRRNDDDEELALLEGAMIRLIWGMKQETTSLTLIPGIGSGDEYIRNFFTISSLVTDATKIYKATQHLMAMAIILAYDEAPEENATGMMDIIYNANVYQRDVGPFEAGTPKIYKDVYDYSGLKNIHDLLRPDYRISQMAKRQ